MTHHHIRRIAVKSSVRCMSVLCGGGQNRLVEPTTLLCTRKSFFYGGTCTVGLPRLTVPSRLTEDQPHFLRSRFGSDQIETFMTRYRTMNVGVATRSQVCLKRLLDEPQEHLLKCKQARLTPPSLRSRSHAPSPATSESLSSIGPYSVPEAGEGLEPDLAIHKHTQQQYTYKVLPLRDCHDRLAACARLGLHDNVCSPLDVVAGQGLVHVFLPRHYGDMHTYVRECRRVREAEAKRLFAQMLTAVERCHARGVVLRDAKLRRFVFTDPDRTSLALDVLEEAVLLDHLHDDALTDRHGCPAYVGPELLTNDGTPYSGRAADIWSLGVSLYTMLIGRYPFQDTQPATLFAKIRQAAVHLPDWLSPQARCVIGCMLRKRPSERLTASELLMHPWLNNMHTTLPPRTRRVQHTTHTLPTSTKVLQHTQQDSDDQVVPTL